MSLRHELIDAINELKGFILDENNLPLTAGYLGNDIPCIAGDLVTSSMLQICGFSADVDFLIVILDSDMPPGVVITDKKIITHRGTNYRISKFRKPPGGGFIVIGCMDPGKGT